MDHVQNTVAGYGNYLDLDIDQKFATLNESLDDTLTRLEEFETLILLVQQQQLTVCEPIASLTLTTNCQTQLKQLSSRVDALEQLVGVIRQKIDALEVKMDNAEEMSGLTDNTNRLKKLLAPLL